MLLKHNLEHMPIPDWYVTVWNQTNIAYLLLLAQYKYYIL